MRVTPEPAQNLRNSSREEGRSDGPPAFIRQRWGIILGVLLITLATAGEYLLVARPQYTSSASLYVQPLGSRAADDKSALAALPINFLNTQREIIVSVPVLSLALKPEIAALKTFDRAGDPLTWLRNELRVQVGKTDDIIHLSLDSPYPQDAADIIQAVVDSYIEFQTGQKKSATSKFLKSYQTKKGEAEAKVVDLDYNMRQIQKKAGTLAFDDTSKGILSRELIRYRQDLLEAGKTTAAARAANEKAVLAWGSAALPDEKAQDSIDPSHATIVLASQADLDRMPGDIIDAERQLEKLREKYLPQHPVVKEALDRIQLLKLRYLTATRRYLQFAEQHEKQLRNDQAEEEKLAEAFAESAAQFARLESEKKELEAESSMLGNRIKEVGLEEDAGALNISTLEAAAPALVSSRPVRSTIMLTALVGGLLGGILLAFLRHLTDPCFHSAEELEAAIELPVLGCVPGGSRTAGNLSPANLVPLDRWSDHAETCRQIASSLNAVCPKGFAPAVLVTSPRSGDGRSTVARDLAIALAITGERVLLVDADFQNPSLHALVGSRNAEGLSNVVQGEISADLAALPTSLAGLEVLTTGPSPALPAALFDSLEFEAFLASASRHYDRVLIDAPPVRGSNDARIAAAVCGATLLVLPHQKLHKRVIREARDRLIGFGANLVGVVMNEVPRRRKVTSRRVTVKRTSVSTAHSPIRVAVEGLEKPSARSRLGSSSTSSMR